MFYLDDLLNQEQVPAAQRPMSHQKAPPSLSASLKSSRPFQEEISEKCGEKCEQKHTEGHNIKYSGVSEGDAKLAYMAGLAQQILSYNKQRRYMDAEVPAMELLSCRRAVFGQEHPDTLTSMIDLAKVYENQSLWEKTDELRSQVTKIREGVFRHDTPIVKGMEEATVTAVLQPREKETPIRFKDAVGRKFTFPFHLCAKWSVSNLSCL